MSIGTWNPSDKVAAVTLSNGDLDASNPATAAWSLVRAVTGHSSGQFYFEVEHVTVGGHTNPEVGVSDAHVLGDGELLGDLASSFGIRANTNLANGVTVAGGELGLGNLGEWQGAGKIAGFAVDLDAKKLWVRNDDGWLSSGDPAAGTNHFASWAGTLTLYPATSLYFITSADVVRYLGNASNQTYAPPTGFTSWDDGGGGGGGGGTALSVFLNQYRQRRT